MSHPRRGAGGRAPSRREWLALTLGIVASPLAAAAAQTGSALRRIGLLAQDLQPGLLETFGDELRQLGWVQGNDIVIDVQDAAGRSDRLPALVDELLRRKVEVIAAVNTPAARAAKSATTDVPIVIMRVADPVRAGLIAGLARPGGNVTGLNFMPDQFGAKGLELLREIRPGVSRVAAIFRGDNPGAVLVVDETERRSMRIGFQKFVRFPVRDPRELPAAFEAAGRARTEAIFVMDDGAITKHRAEILDLAAQHALPVVSIYKDFAEAGGLVAYGPNLDTVYRRAAHYVDRILKGARPNDLPVEQPTKLDIVINLNTARALHLTVPRSVLLRADHVIQ